MLEAIRKTNSNTDYMYVVDTRPRVSVTGESPEASINANNPFTPFAD